MRPKMLPGKDSTSTGPAAPRVPSTIELDRVCVTSADTHATMLAATSASVHSGQVAVLRGENGAGKTTPLRVLAGRIAPTSGTARACGLPIDERDPRFRRRVAAMIGLPPMAPDLTVRDHIALIAATWHDTHGLAASATETVLDELGLASPGSRFPGELSSGQTQLFGLAMVLVRPFDILLLDEPEQRLDPGRIARVAESIGSRRDRGATIVIATHSEALVAACWATSLLIGRRRGPALLPPFLVYAIAASDFKRSQSLCGPVTRTAVWASLAVSIAASFMGAVLVHAESATLLSALGFVGAGLAAGVIATLCAVVGQAFPRAAAFLSSGIFTTSFIFNALPLPLVIAPWGWVAAAFPTSPVGATGVMLSVAGLASFALGFVLVTPRILDRMSLEQLSTQAAQWDAAMMFSSTLDLALITAVYQERPRIGRHIQAVRNQRGLPVMFLLRDAIGLTRTPGRLTAAVATTVAAGILLSSISALPTHPALPAILAAALLYFATGVFGQGLQHAAHVAADYPLYGISDRSLIGYQSLFPIASIGVLVTVSIAAISVSSRRSPGHSANCFWSCLQDKQWRRFLGRRSQ